MTSGCHSTRYGVMRFIRKQHQPLNNVHYKVQRSYVKPKGIGSMAPTPPPGLFVLVFEGFLQFEPVSAFILFYFETRNSKKVGMGI
jgi:hypothetical protein